MAEDKFGFITRGDYIQEIEDQIKGYMTESIELPHYSDIIKKVEIPIQKDLSPIEWNRWCLEELHRCKYGYGEMTGKMYFYFNYGRIQNLTQGSFSPDFRSADAEWFKLMEECTASKKYGIVCVKRRRGGFSWKEAADCLHDAIFSKFFHVGMNSRTERDSYHLFEKIMFMYQNLPPFMRASIGKKAGMQIEFFKEIKDEDGVKKKIGNQSSIVVVPPTVSAYEGRMLNKWVCDEAGKIEHLPQLWSFTEECLMQETQRVGVPVLFGTSGEVDKAGKGLMQMWNKAEYYNLKRFFFAGWMGLHSDKLGNDNKEEAIRWVLYTRRIKEKISPKEYNDFLQKYPLTTNEAFSQAAGGLGDVVKVNAQKASLRTNPPIISEGTMDHHPESGEPKFTPQRFGDVKVFEHPSIDKDYLAACDPADHDDAQEGASDLSLHIMSMPDGIEPAKVVLEYVARPAKLADYYEKAAMCLSYYNNTRCLVENNRIRMIDYFKENGYGKLLELAPPPINGVFHTKASKIGVRMTEDFKRYMESLIEEYIDDYCDYIPSLGLLEEFGMYGGENTDRVMSFGIALTLLRSKMKFYKKNDGTAKTKLPSSKVFTKSGRLVRDGMVGERRKQPTIPGRSTRASKFGL